MIIFGYFVYTHCIITHIRVYLLCFFEHVFKLYRIAGSSKTRGRTIGPCLLMFGNSVNQTPCLLQLRQERLRIPLLFLCTLDDSEFEYLKSSIMPRKEINIGPISAQAQQDLVTEGIENFELPRSVVQRLAKASV